VDIYLAYDIRFVSHFYRNDDDAANTPLSSRYYNFNVGVAVNNSTNELFRRLNQELHDTPGC